MSKLILISLLLVSFPLAAQETDPCEQTCPTGEVLVSLLVGESDVQCFCSPEATMDETEPTVSDDMIPEAGAA